MTIKWLYQTQQNEAHHFFSTLFAPPVQHQSVPLPLDNHATLSHEGKTSLHAPVTKDEGFYALKFIKSFKAPGPDGFQPFFFKKYWDIIGDDIRRLVQGAFDNGRIDSRMAETLIVLIPKVDHPTRISQFRPISLCNVIYKLVTKVLVNRIRPFLDELVGPLQSSFIPGRGTVDNAIVAQEILHYMHKTISKMGSAVFKIDLEKAYDSVDWGFLRNTLHDFDLPDRIINLIMSCVTSSSLSILWNGNKLDSFHPTRGLRQGDPMSPYLFVLCMEKLAMYIN